MEPHTSELLKHLQAYGTPDEGRLIAALYDRPIEQAGTISGTSADKLHRLQLDAFSYFYHYATLIAVFDDRLRERDLQHADKTRENAFEVLAGARRRIENNSQLAWEMIGSFRRFWNIFHPEDADRELKRLDPPPLSLPQGGNLPSTKEEGQI
jgi:hypothetical protein